jgi:hypothetical protein
LEAVIQSSFRELIATDTVKLAAESLIVAEDPKAALAFLAEAG